MLILSFKEVYGSGRVRIWWGLSTHTVLHSLDDAVSAVAHLISFLVDHINHFTETRFYTGSTEDEQYRHSHFVDNRILL